MRNIFIKTLTEAGYKEHMDDGAKLWVLGKIEVVITDTDQIILFDGPIKIGVFDSFHLALETLHLA
jgi:hypothetical protein